MKKFTKQEIYGARKYFKGRKFQEVDVNLGNRSFSYFVMPQILAPELPDFVFRCTGNPGDGYVFGISDSVAEQYRQYAVAHEFIEFTEIGMETPNRCVKALEEELKLVPEEIKPDYLRMRKTFFDTLIKYCAKHTEDYTENDMREFKQTLSRLEQLVK